MKKIISIFSIVLLVCMIASTAVMAAGDVVTFDGGNSITYSGEPLTIKVVINEDANVGFVTGTILYDASVWSISGLSGIPTMTKAGEIALNKSDMNDIAYKAGDAILTFTATALDESKIESQGNFTINQFTLASGDFSYMPYDGTGADIVLSVVTKTEDPTYTVTFKDGDTVVAEKTATKDNGYKVTAPAADEKKGYTFDGWFNGEDKFDADAAVSADVTYTAKYTKINATEPTFAKNEVIGTVEIDGNEYTDIFKGEYSYTLNEYTKVTKVGVNVKSVATDVTKAFDKEVSIEGATTVAFKLALLGVDDTAKLETSALVEYADRY